MPSFKKVFEKTGLFIIPLLLFTAALFLLASGDCKNNSTEEGGPQKKTPAVILENKKGDKWEVKVEIARTEAEKRKGLMFRKNLAEDHGMLFVYDDAKVRVFWMKNTYIPLDMIFIGPDKRIAGIVENAAPETRTPRKINKPSQFVLEVKGGQADKHGLGPGDRVYFKGME